MLAPPARADLTSAGDAPARALLVRTVHALERLGFGPPRPIPGSAPAAQPRIFLGSAATVRTALSFALAGSDDFLYLDAGKRARLDRAFRAQFGRPLIRRTVRGRTEYDPAGLRAAFRAIYVGPDARIGGIPARELYRPLRGFVASAAQTVAHLIQDPRRLERAAHHYDARGAFDYGLIERLYPEVDTFEVITVGVVLRRQLDGTLPVLVEALRTVLSDYDPETFAELDRSLTVGGTH